MVPPGPAALAGFVIFFVPGVVFLALLRRDDRCALAWDEALFLVVGSSVAASAWVGLVLAELGLFSLVGAAGVLAVASALALLVGRRRWGGPWPPRPTPWGSVVPALVVLAASLLLHARPSEYIVGGRDPGAYVAAMALVGRTGGIVTTDATVLSIPREDMDLFFRNPTNPDFTWGRFMGFPLERPETGRVFPEFYHLFPTFGAYLFQSMGVKGGLATSPIFGVLGTLGVFFVLRRLFGPPAALLGALLLATNVVQVWFARYPVSEPMSQFLLFLGLLAFLLWEERGSAALGLLAGAAFGLSLLVRIDSVLVVVPLGAYVLVRRARRDLPWRRALPVLVPFVALGAHSLLHAMVFARKYLLAVANRPYWRQPPEAWVAAAVLALGLALTVHAVGPRVLRWLGSHREGFRTGVLGAITVLALYAYFLRPWLSAWAGGDGNDSALALSDPWLLGRLGFGRLAAHDAQALVRLGWFVTPLGLVLGLLGLLATIRGLRPRDLFPVLLTLTFSLFYLYKIRVWNDYYFALRRFVPVTLPFLLGFAALALVRAARGGRASRIAAGGATLALLVGFGRDTWPLVTYRDWKNTVRFVDDVSRRFGADDVVVFEQAQSIHLLSLPLWAVHGKNVVELARFRPDPERLRHVVEAWRGRYKNVYFVRTYRSGSDFCGIFLEQGERLSFGTYEWQRAYDGKPKGPEPRSLEFSISRVVPPEKLQVPPLPEVDVGGTDDIQVSGFFDKEGGGDLTYRWTGPCASVYLPGAVAGASVVLRTSTGQRPLDRPAVVRVSLSGLPLGEFDGASSWVERTLRLPNPLPPGPPVLRLEVPSWRPANVLPGSLDTRDLGIMVDRIRVIG